MVAFQMVFCFWFLFFKISSTSCPQTRQKISLVFVSIFPLADKNLLLEEMPFHTQGKEMREPPNVRIKLISKSHNDLLRTPVITAIHVSDSSLAPTRKGVQVSNLSHFPHFCRKSCISSHSPSLLGGGCTVGHHSQIQANAECTTQQALQS